jgi:hypothetical protein
VQPIAWTAITAYQSPSAIQITRLSGAGQYLNKTNIGFFKHGSINSGKKGLTPFSRFLFFTFLSLVPTQSIGTRNYGFQLWAVILCLSF